MQTHCGVALTAREHLICGSLITERLRPALAGATTSSRTAVEYKTFMLLEVRWLGLSGEGW